MLDTILSQETSLRLNYLVKGLGLVGGQLCEGCGGKRIGDIGEFDISRVFGGYEADSGVGSFCYKVFSDKVT